MGTGVLIVTNKKWLRVERKEGRVERDVTSGDKMRVSSLVGGGKRLEGRKVILRKVRDDEFWTRRDINAGHFKLKTSEIEPLT